MLSQWIDPKRAVEQARQTDQEKSTSKSPSTMANVPEAVKESLLGTTREPELSSQTRAAFDRNAKKDEATGEYYLTESEFVDAVAPEGEDYVSCSIPGLSHRICKKNENMLTSMATAQDKKRAIRYPVPDRRSTESW